MSPRADQLLASARDRLAQASFQPPPREALLLLARALGVSEVALLAHPELAVDDDAERRFAALLERRLRGEPVAYLFAEKEFYGREFAVDARVLVPRPETEHLVEAAIARARRAGRTPHLIEVGTGSGCIAITLALELGRGRTGGAALEAGPRVTATDVSIAALAVAAANRARHAAPVGLIAARMLDGIDIAGADLVIANLPYLDPARTEGLSMEVLRWEPPQALFGGAGGLERFRELFRSTAALRRGAALLLEIGADQADAVAALAAQYHLRHLETVRDYAGCDRVLVLER